MHVLLAVLGVLGAGAFWWYRMKYLGQAAGEVVDTADRIRGAYRRKQFKKKADAATIDAIADPRTAATVLLVAIASADGPLGAEHEAAIKDAMVRVMAVDKPEEELIFAKWAATDVADLNGLVSRLAKVWTAKLDMPERQELYDLAQGIATLDGPADDVRLSALRRLKDRLGLAANPDILQPF
jgi:uncharacterized tellurite resistance protein B-like protein